MSEEQSLNNEDQKEQVKTEQVQENKQEENSEDINWKSFREERKKDREARKQAEEEALRRAKEAEALKKAMDAILSKPEPTSSENVDDGHKSIRAEMERLLEEREKKREAERLEKERQQMPIKLRQELPDFDSVVNEENIDYMQYKYPHIYNAFSAIEDSPQKWKDLYKTIKQFVPTTNEDQKRLEKNMNKPKSLSGGLASTGDVAPIVISDQTKAANWERMRRSMKEV